MKKRFLAVCMVIVFALTPVLYSCGNTPDSNGGSNDTSETAEIVDNDSGSDGDDATAKYDYPELDMGGRDFRILNSEPVWNFTTTIVVEEATEDILNDAIYNRNKLIEEKFNINMVEIPVHIDQIEAKTKTAGQAGDDAYDIILCPRSNQSPIGALITTGLFLNLDSIPEINLDGDWWKASSIESSRLGANNAIYFLQSEMTVMALQGVWCLFFNENMMADLGLEPPYQLVRDGKWTLAELQKYVKTGMSLNGDESFNWDPDGKSVYGLTSPLNAMAAFVTGIDEPYIKKDSDNLPYLSIENERFYSGIDRILEITGAQGQYIEANEDRNTSLKNYELMFESRRAFFIIAEFKTADLFRAMDDSFGILPMPKYDESQSNYSHMVFRQCPVLVIPQTNSIPHETGAIVDALEFASHTQVTPVYYDISLSFKGLRNDDSIEMMHIINDTVSLDLGITYDWTRTLYDSFNEAISKGEVNVASLIEKRKDAVNKSIDKTLGLLDSMEEKLN